MKKILFFAVLFFLCNCTGVRRVQTGIRQGINNASNQDFSWGEVYCGQGTVCSEIEVVRVDFEDRDTGQVQVKLHNRTGVNLQVQIGLEILNAQGAILDQSTFQNLGIPASQEVSWSMPGIYQKGAKIRVVLRKI